MALKRLHTAVAAVGIVAVGIAAWWWQNGGSAKFGRTGPGAATAAAGPAASGGRGGPPGGPGGPGGPAAVEVGRVESRSISDDAQAVGSLRSSQGVMLRPEVSGRIARFGFQDGERVRRGQLLVQLDDTLQRAQHQQALAQSAIARTNLQRSRELLAQGFVSQSAVDQNAANLEVGDAQVALAQAQLARMQMLAPFDATAGIRKVAVGDYLKDGADVVNLEDLSSLTVDFPMPERYLARLRSGQAVEVSIDAFPGRVFAGRVVALDSQIDADGRALLVRAKVDNPGALLRPGMFARARVVFAVRANALLVPEEALLPLDGRQFVFKVIDGANGQKLSQRVEAKVGVRVAGKVEILEGVSAGDAVVTAGQGRLLRGDRLPVRVIDLAKAGAPARPGQPANAASAGAGRAAPAASGAASAAA